LEQRVHDALRERMKAAHRGRDLDLGAIEVRHEVREKIEQILSEPGYAVDEGEIDLLSEVAMYLRLNRRVILAGTELADRAEDGMPRAFELRLRQFETAMANELGLRCELGSMREDLEALDAQFELVYARHRLAIDPGLKQFLVQSRIIHDIESIIFGLGPLQDLQDASAVSEIMVVSREHIFVEKAGVIERTRREFLSDEALEEVIKRIVAPLGKTIDRSNPLADARLPDGSRVNAVLSPIAVKGPTLTIRKFSKRPITIQAMERKGTLTPIMTRFLKACVAAKKNIVISGGTGSGKTTMLNALSKYIGERERVVTIEDTAELRILAPHVVTLEARSKNVEGKGEITLQDLVRNALRMRPDRIVVGECRGGETLDMLQAMNTGHSGSMTTGHANNPQDMMNRLETMVLMGMDMPVSAIRQQIAAAVDVVVQLNRSADGVRRVTHISEVAGLDRDRGELIVEDVFAYLPGSVNEHADGERTGGEFVHTGYLPQFMGELIDGGHLRLDAFFGVEPQADRGHG
jgi:pilus assembly protein CpaF